MNREQLLENHNRLCTTALNLMRKKNHDYAGRGGESPFANFTRCESMGICTTEQGFLVRMTDKMSRLSSFIEAGTLQVKDESVEDTILDIINYAVLFQSYLQEKKENHDPVEPVRDPVSAVHPVSIPRLDVQYGTCRNGLYSGTTE
jgi:hypothetical protein